MIDVLEIKDLNKTYNNKLVALKNINLSVEQGQLFGLLGINGAGKSTMLNIVSSLLLPTSGSVKILGYDLFTNPRAAKRLMGVVPQEINLAAFIKVKNIMLYQAGYYGLVNKDIKKRIQYLLEHLNLWDKREENVISLSGGMKKKINDSLCFNSSTKTIVTLMNLQWELMLKSEEKYGTLF